MQYILYDCDLLDDHVFLLFAHGLDFDHLYGVTVDFSFFAALEDFAGGSCPYFSDKFVVAYLFQSLSHKSKNIIGTKHHRLKARMRSGSK